MISIENLVKRHGEREVLHGVSLEARPGRVTGFVGPNGAGKSSTLRCLLGLDQADGGRTLIGGYPYRELREPLRTVGAVLDGSGAHPSRTARGHLGWVASGAGISRRRVAEVLDVVGLSEAAGRRVRTFSLGMGQRLGLATALLGDPEVLVLDEPVNGLDPVDPHAASAEGRCRGHGPAVQSCSGRAGRGGRRRRRHRRRAGAGRRDAGGGRGGLREPGGGLLLADCPDRGQGRRSGRPGRTRGRGPFMSAATALVRSLKAEVRKTMGLPGAWLGAALAIFLPLLIEYYTDHGLAARLAAGDPDAPAQLGNVGVIGLYVGTTGIVVLAVSVVVSEYASDPRTSGASGAPRQVTTTILVQPRRGASVAAKLLVVLGAATVLLAVAWTATYSLCRHLLGSSVPFEPVPWWMLTGILTWWVFSAMASMALAMATRSALVSMTVLVAMSTMISPGVLLIKSTDAARFLPDTAAVRLIANPTTLNYDRLVELLPIPMAAAVCTAWAGGCAAVCCWVWMRRDA